MPRTYSRRKVVTTLAGAGTIGVLSGCVGEVDDPPDPDGGGDGGTGQITVGVPQFGLWDTTIPWLVSDEMGFYEDEGVEVERLDISGGGENVRTVASGDAQIAFATGIFSVMAAYREGTPARVVSNQWSSASDLFWYVTDDSDIEEGEDLDGATVGYSNPGSSTHMVVLGANDEFGIDTEDTSVGSPPDAYAATVTDEIDVGWATPPFFLDEIEEGELRRVFTGDEVPPFDDLTIRVNLASDDWLNSEPETAEAFFRATQQAIDWAYDNIEEATELWAEVADADEDLLVQAVEDAYPKEHMDLHEFRNLDTAMDLAVQHDFIDERFSDDELDEFIQDQYLP